MADRSVFGLVSIYSSALKESKTQLLDGFCRTAIARLRFESIYLFEYGNGRIGRTILDMALAKDYPHSMRIYSISN